MSSTKENMVKNIEKDLKNQRMYIHVAQNIAMDCQEWKNTVNSAKNPAAPTAAYWLRDQRGPAVAS